MAKGKKTGGRVKGSKCERLILWDEMGDWIASEGTDKYIEYLKTLKGEDYMMRFEAILEYFKPKKARTELVNEEGKKFLIKLD